MRDHCNPNSKSSLRRDLRDAKCWTRREEGHFRFNCRRPSLISKVRDWKLKTTVKEELTMERKETRSEVPSAGKLGNAK